MKQRIIEAEKELQYCNGMKKEYLLKRVEHLKKLLRKAGANHGRMLN
jgi:hypothetical protein